ncbi:predicted protein [Lichtheimia corymbifera JMRC:FSU:9682]|uniref:Uncharacterized protein n=1 Tax=Lichtheimia corymbifera JMRC:FSU:9682 TaxID=1263082 RepID=A0A068RJS1_9FUNG|nr:predicted protein [Lichtheimia corymbifera JMRC:FSU:9682]
MDHVQNHIRASMATCNGRTSVAELAQELNVEHEAILDNWSVLAPEENWIKAGDDILLTSEYVDTLPSQLDTDIEANGHCSLVTLARQWKLPYNFIVEALEPYITQHYVRYQQLPDTIMTRDYANKAKQYISDALQQATEPLSMFKLQRNTSILGSQEALYYAILDNVIREEQAPGTFRGRREKSIFIPHSYKDRQLSLISSLLEAGGYIEYDTVEQHYSYSNPKDLLLRLDGDITLLDTCGATQSLIKDIENHMEEQLSTRGWADVSQLAPFAFSASDVGSLLDVLTSRATRQQQRQRTILNACFIVTSDFISTTVSQAQPLIDRLALKEIQQEKRLHSGKSKRKLVNEVAVHLSNQEISGFLVDQQGLSPAFAENLVPVLKKPMTEALAKAIQTVYVSPSLVSAGQDDKYITQQQANMKDLARKIYFTFQSIDHFQDESARKSLEKYIVRQLGLQYLFGLTALKEMERTGDGEGTMKKFDVNMDEAQKKELLATFTNDDDSSLYTSILNGKKAEQLIEHLKKSSFLSEGTLEEQQMQANKDVQESLWQQLKSTPVSQATAPSILHLTSLLCFQALYQQPLYVSGKFVPHIIKQITPTMDETLAGLLKDGLAMASPKNAQAIDIEVFRKVQDLGLEQQLNHA